MRSVKTYIFLTIICSIIWLECRIWEGLWRQRLWSLICHLVTAKILSQMKTPMIIFKRQRSLQSEHLTRLWNLIRTLISQKPNRVSFKWENSLQAKFRLRINKHLRDLKIPKCNWYQRRKRTMPSWHNSFLTTMLMLKNNCLRNLFNLLSSNNSKPKIMKKLHLEGRS